MLAAGSRVLSLQLGGRNAQKAKMSQLTFNLQPTRQILTVSELTARIRDLLARNFTATFVQGEISNCREAQSGHLYFTLKDDRAQVRCVFFKQQQRGTRFRPEDGLQVTVRGTLSVYEQRGEYQIYVENIEPVGLGALQLAFDQLKKRLEAEGLFAAARKKPLPLLPSRIGHESDFTIADFVADVRASTPSAAAELVVQTRREFDKHIADLRGALAEQMRYRILVLSRRIHELGARPGFRRPLDLLRQQRQRADEMTARLALGLRARLDQSRKRFAVAHLRIVSFDFRVKIAAFRSRLARGAADLGIRAERLLRSKRERLARLALQLEERSPLRVLERGYAIATDASGAILRDAAQVQIRDSVSLQLHRGRLQTEVRKKETP